MGTLDEAAMFAEYDEDENCPGISVYVSFINKALLRINQGKHAMKFHSVERRKGTPRYEEITSFIVQGLCVNKVDLMML